MVAGVVFPGQGSQRAGMGADFAERFKVSRAVFEESTATLGYDVAEFVKAGDERLNLTEFTQPCIVTAEVAMLAAMRAEYGFEADR